MMGLSMLLALALQLAAAAPVPDEPAPPSPRLEQAAPTVAAMPNTRLAGYPVSGSNLRRLRTTMSEAGPTDPSGQRHHALTTWRIQPKLLRRNGECDPQSADAEYTITVTLPDLETRDRLGRGETEHWDRYFSALVAHEMNHARIVAAGVDRVKAAMRAAVGCEAIHAAARTAMAEISAASAQYDQQTRHGRTEGAVL